MKAEGLRGSTHGHAEGHPAAARQSASARDGHCLGSGNTPGRSTPHHPPSPSAGQGLYWGESATPFPTHKPKPQPHRDPTRRQACSGWVGSHVPATAACVWLGQGWHRDHGRARLSRSALTVLSGSCPVVAIHLTAHAARHAQSATRRSLAQINSSRGMARHSAPCGKIYLTQSRGNAIEAASRLVARRCVASPLAVSHVSGAAAVRGRTWARVPFPPPPQALGPR